MALFDILRGQSISKLFAIIFLFRYVHGQVSVATAPSYVPIVDKCPKGQPLLRLAGSANRSNQTLSEGESFFRAGRKNLTSSLWRQFFTTGPGANTGYKSTSLLEKNHNDWPVLGLAHSGGGERASLYGAGVVQALDGRSTSSPVRGILQLATYQTGLSGGSWLVMSLATNDFPPVADLVSGWELEKDIFFPGGGNVIKDSAYVDQLLDTTEKKEDAKFLTSITDVWGLALARHFLPGTNSANFFQASSETAHGSGILFSALTKLRGFKDFQSPYPIIVSNNLPPKSLTTNQESQLPIQGQTFVPLSTTVYEFTPLEFGSFDPYLSAFTPTEYLGTRLEFGKPGMNSTCVTAYDQASFVMGTSATLFNAILPGFLGGIKAEYRKLLEKFASKFNNNKGIESATVAHYPNPFKGVNGPLGFDGSKLDDLELVDGGENGENLPLNPLLAPSRQVDVILAADASADTNSSDPRGANWPNGASMINTFLRVTRVLPKGSAPFPQVPLDPKVWSEKGYSTRPTFFGCDAPTQRGNGGFPLIIYIPNAPSPQSSFKTNTSTFKLKYSKEEAESFLDATVKTVSEPVVDSKVDKDWPTCLACALIDRSRNRKSVKRSSACNTCFRRYCYKS